MSEKGGGGRVSRAFGCGNSGGGGDTRGGGNGNRNSHFKVMGNDSKYGMLLWQSKLQEKLLKEQKEKKAEQATMRRKSDEEYHTFSTNANGTSNDNSISLANYTGGATSGMNRSKSRQEAGETREIHVPIMMPTSYNNSSGPTVDFAANPPSLVLTNVDDISTSFTIDKNQSSPRQAFGPSDNNPIHPGGSQLLNNYNYREAGGSLTPRNSGGVGKGISNKYQKDQPPILPKLLTNKLNSSVSCDNLSRNIHQLYGNPAFFGISGGGAGAPRRSPSGKPLTNIQGHADIRYHQKDTRGFDQTLRYMMDKDTKTKYREDLDKQLEEKQRWKMAGNVGTIKIMSSHDRLHEIQYEDDSQSSREGGFLEDPARRLSRNGSELAPLIRKYKSLPKLNTLNSTDVTKSFVSSPRRSDIYSLSPEPEEVARGLAMQLVEKRKIHQIQQENDKLATERHFNTWDSFWGRPGHGAPIFYTRSSPFAASTSSLFSPRVVHNKTDLFKAIHMTHQQNKPT